jgi:hypothetical protein
MLKGYLEALLGDLEVQSHHTGVPRSSETAPI